MNRYEQLRDRLARDIEEHETKAALADEDAARAALRGNGSQYQPAIRIADKNSHAASHLRRVLAAVDRVEQAEKHETERKAQAHASTLAELHAGQMKPYELRTRAERVLSALSRKYPRQGSPLTGSDLGRWVYGKPLEETALEVLRAAAKSQQPIGLVQHEAARFLAEFEKGI
jgi:hypothetical protein